MKQFFYVLFGGLCAVGCGVGIAYGGALTWKFAVTELPTMRTSVTSVIQAIVHDTNADTFIAELKRKVRFSAIEEEDATLLTPESISPTTGDVTARTYVVKRLTGNGVHIPIGREADTLAPVASLTKMVTAVVARRLIDPEKRITITKDIMTTYGNTASFTTGETFRAEDLLYPLLMVSSNDAAEAFAQSYGRKAFLKAMNEFAQEVGAYRTYFADPSGLSPANVSTANDLALILDWIRLNDPHVIEITSEKTRTVRSHTWVNPTHFLSWSYYLGGKNGYIPEAERTAMSLFTIGESKDIYAVVILGSLARDGDTMKLLAKIGE